MIDLGQGEVPLRQHEQLGLLEALIIAGNDSTVLEGRTLHKGATVLL